MRIGHAPSSTNKENECFRLLVVTDAIHNFCEGDILAYIGNLDRHTLALLSIGNDKLHGYSIPP